MKIESFTFCISYFMLSSDVPEIKLQFKGWFFKTKFHFAFLVNMLHLNSSTLHPGFPILCSHYTCLFLPALLKFSALSVSIRLLVPAQFFLLSKPAWVPQSSCTWSSPWAIACTSDFLFSGSQTEGWHAPNINAFSSYSNLKPYFSYFG